MDEGRKRELVMEKNLRACRVNIIPRSEDYFRSTAPPRARSSTPAPALTPSPEAVQKASNPIALRYWNQCLEKNSDIMSSSPSSNKSDENENERVGRKGKEEARYRINQFVTVDKMKKSGRDQGALARSASESRLRNDDDRMLRNQSSKLYTQVKAEQIKLTENRTEFQNRAVHFTGKSPQPFRRGASETRGFVPTRSNETNTNTSSMVNLNDVNQNLIPNLTNTQKMNLVQMLLENLPTQLGDKLLAERLSSLPCDRLRSVIANISEPTVNAAVPLMFPRTKDDVKLSLVLESVPKLTKLLRQN